jgi:hypothetical protein
MIPPEFSAWVDCARAVLSGSRGAGVNVRGRVRSAVAPTDSASTLRKLFGTVAAASAPVT